MAKKERIVDLKVAVLRQLKKRIKDGDEILNSWLNNRLSDRIFATRFTQKFQLLEEELNLLIERAMKFGRFDEKTVAKNFHRVYEELAPKYGYETKKESRVEFDKLPRLHQRLMIATAKKVIERIITTEKID